MSDLGSELQIPVISETEGGEQHLVVCGDIYNERPQIVDASNLIYRYNAWADGTNTESFALRDQGLDITDHVNLDTPTPGLFKFKSGHNPAGALRFDCTTSYKTSFDIIQKIADMHNLGVVQKTSFTAFENNAVIGFTIKSNINIDTICDQIMLNLGGYVQRDERGGIRLLMPVIGASLLTVTKDDIKKGLKQSDSIPAFSKVVVNYRKNQSPNLDSELATKLDTPELKEPFQYIYRTLEKTTGASGFDSRVYNSFYVNSVDAQTFIDNRAVWFSAERANYSFDLFDISKRLHVANQIAINHPYLTATLLITKIIKGSGILNEIEGMVI